MLFITDTLVNIFFNKPILVLGLPAGSGFKLIRVIIFPKSIQLCTPDLFEMLKNK